MIKLETGVFLGKCGTNPEFDSVYRIGENNLICNRLYVKREEFQHCHDGKFDDSCINNYQWTFHKPSFEQEQQFLECEKQRKFVKIQNLINKIEIW